MEHAAVRYAWNGDVSLAYQVFGSGPVDLVYLQGYASNVDLNWESPHLARFLTGLGRLARVIHTDRRGWGCSDRFSPGDVAPLEVQVDDLVAVMDAAGSQRAVIFTSLDTCPAGILFAVTHPDRTAGLVLVDPMLAYSDTEEVRREWEVTKARVRREHGTPAYYAEDWHDDHERVQWYARWCRGSVAPGALVAEVEAFGPVDVRDVMSLVQAPTLVCGRADHDGQPETKDPILRFAATDAAPRVPGARLIEPDVWPGVHWFHWYARGPAILTAVGELIAGIQEEEASFDRFLATVLFSDIVGSTATAARLGDRSWRDLLGRHHAIVRNLLGRYRGVEVDTAGDGFFATFDGPARAVTCGKAIVAAVRPLGIEVRIGVHTGEVETIDGKAGGLAVVIGSRVGSLAGASEVLTTQTVKDLTVGSRLAFEDAGEHELKGVPDRWSLYRVTT